MKSCPVCHRDYPSSWDRCPDDGNWLVADAKPADPADRFLGRVLGQRYRLDHKLGAGSVGIVFRGVDLGHGTPIALKLLMPRGFAEPRAARRLKREFRALSQIDNPHIVKAFELGETEEGIPYLVMEYVEGRDLDLVLEEEGWLEPGRVVHLALQLLDALHTAHQQGIIHRDLKPDNIHLTYTNQDPEFVKVLDFGLAKFFQVGEQHATALTAAHLVVGTPHYMAPEQIRGGEVGPWTDLYALGTLLYRALVGQLPFPGTDPVQVMSAHCRQRPVPPRMHRPTIPPALEALILELLEKDASRRPRSALWVRDRLSTQELLSLRDAARRHTQETMDGRAGHQLPGGARAGMLPPLQPGQRPRTAVLPPDQRTGSPLPSSSAPPHFPKPAEQPFVGEPTISLPPEPSFLWLIILAWSVATITAVCVAFILQHD